MHAKPSASRRRSPGHKLYRKIVAIEKKLTALEAALTVSRPPAGEPEKSSFTPEEKAVYKPPAPIFDVYERPDRPMHGDTHELIPFDRPQGAASASKPFSLDTIIDWMHDPRTKKTLDALLPSEARSPRHKRKRKNAP